MEERNLEFDDDGKIKLKRKNENFLQEGDAAAEDEIVIDVPDFKGFGEENEGGAVSDEELARRKAAWTPREPKVTTGYLKRYAKMVSSANKGAILEF